MLSTPIKIKQETTEVTHARVKFEGVLQNLIERADESLPLDEEIQIKEERDFDRSFDDDIKELESTPGQAAKSPSKSRKRRKREFASSDVEPLDDSTKSHNSFVMKLFDRSVDLAQFRPQTSLYPVCRAWMANTPNAKMPRRDSSPSPEPLPDSDLSENGLIYRLPSPTKTWSEMRDELSRDPRIPSPVPQPEETLDIHADSSEAPSKETLLNNHLQRWKVVRNNQKTRIMDASAEDEDVQDDKNVGRKRADNGKKATMKRRRAQGQAYISTSGKVFPARQATIIECRCGCCNKFTAEERSAIFSSFLDLQDHDKQNIYLQSCVMQKNDEDVRRRRRNEGVESTRKSYIYSASVGSNVQYVCKAAFCALHGIKESRLKKKVLNFHSDIRDRRGKHNNHNNQKKNVKQWYRIDNEGAVVKVPIQE